MDFKSYALAHQNEICLELERVSLLLEKSGNPQRSMRITHVAGTNGKGSVCSFICAGLCRDGKKTGRFSSPELFDITDTISVNFVAITRAELDDIYEFLAPLCNEIELQTGKMPSQFEINFVAALIHFKNKGCSDAVLECGMGGLGDATNAIDDSYLSVITPIALDHQKFLGDTIEEIAVNKCGIFKKSSHIVTGFQTDSVMEVIKHMAKGRKLIIAHMPDVHGYDGYGEVISYKDIGKVKLSLPGTYQVVNAAIATEAMYVLGIEAEHIRYALSSASNPARFEQVEEGVFFDGAHNPRGAGVLCESINRYFDGGEMIFVVGFMADKDYASSLECLKLLKNIKFKIYTVNVRSNPRSESAQRLARLACELGYEAKAFEDVSAALFEAKQYSVPIVIFGSLYMYKEYMGRWQYEDR